LDSQGRGFAEVVPPGFCRSLLLEALRFQWPSQCITMLGRDGSISPRNPIRASMVRAQPRSRLSDRPTVSLDVISLVVSSCGYDRGHIEHRVAQECAVLVATQRGRAERPQHHHPPRAQPVAPLRECNCRRPWLTPRRCTAQAPHRAQEQPGGPHGRSNDHRCTMPRDAWPALLSSFSPPANGLSTLDACWKLLI
jgi:hypothetical protein